jgi:hypothetical protein
MEITVLDEKTTLEVASALVNHAFQDILPVGSGD